MPRFYGGITRMCDISSHKRLHYANVRSNVAHMNRRRVAAATSTNAKTPGRGASKSRRSPAKGDMTVLNALRAGGLLGLTTKETLG